MKIYVNGAIGQGATTLAAFDNALVKTKTANFNLIRLSSVIPPHAEVILDADVADVPDLPGEWGDRLYVVYAEMRTEVHNEEAWAGIGWVIDPASGKGLFVEHEGHSEQKVRRDIADSLKGLLENRGMAELPIQMKVVGAKCEGQPICAFVVAAYQVSDWENKPMAAKTSLGQKLNKAFMSRRRSDETSLEKPEETPENQPATPQPIETVEDKNEPTLS